MAKQWKMPFIPGLDGAKIRGEYTDDVGVITAIGTDEIAVYIGDDVPLYVQNTMTAGWRWLYDGVSERNLLDGPFAGSNLYTGSQWDIMTENDRRTESVLATLTEDDIIIAMGTSVTAVGDVNYLEDSFKRLIEFALEETLKAA